MDLATGVGGKEVLLQKRASTKRTWPDTHDISAAGHIDFGETPIVAAVRETHEEIGIKVPEEELRFFYRHRAHLMAGNNIENEHQWLYLLRLSGDVDFALQDREVDSLSWKLLEDFDNEVHRTDSEILYVPHGPKYYGEVVSAINAA